MIDNSKNNRLKQRILNWLKTIWMDTEANITAALTLDDIQPEYSRL